MVLLEDNILAASVLILLFMRLALFTAAETQYVLFTMCCHSDLAGESDRALFNILCFIK